MRLISLLNHYQHFTFEISVRPRRGSRPVCSGCHRRSPAYDHLKPRRFEFVPLWGCMVVLLYCMRRVDCRTCGVRVEAVPRGIGKHQLTKAYMLFLAHWARMLSWQETAVSFRTTWDKVCQSVEYVVQWGIMLMASMRFLRRAIPTRLRPDILREDGLPPMVRGRDAAGR